ncbi:MAG: hypothetical protein VB135_04390, partial [Burkholderia sp.]
FKLIESAEQSWRRIRAPEKLAEMLSAIAFKDGVPVTDSTPAQQPLSRLIMPTPCTPDLTLTLGRSARWPQNNRYTRFTAHIPRGRRQVSAYRFDQTPFFDKVIP